MENIRGRIIHNGNVVAKDVDISLVHKLPRAGVLGEWYGTHNASGLLHLDKCTLELEDGRSGEIIIISNHEFRGSGPLQ